MIQTPLAPDAEAAEIEEDSAKNADAFTELIQVLDDRGLSLVTRNAVDDGRKALSILRKYLSKGKPHVICYMLCYWYYMLWTKTASKSLKSGGEIISDILLIAMIIKGLPSEEYKAFSTVVTKKDKEQSFSKFKVLLRSFEKT